MSSFSYRYSGSLRRFLLKVRWDGVYFGRSDCVSERICFDVWRRGMISWVGSCESLR